MAMMNKKQFDGKCREFRKTLIRITSESNSSHLGGMLSCMEILTYLYCIKMNFGRHNFKSKERDKLILSKGHAALAIYVILNDLGIISSKTLNSYCSDGGKLIGHTDHKVPGIEASTGSLGHGLPIAVGLALGNKLYRRTSHVYAVLGDGECNEGSVWEAAYSASRFKLDNLTVIVDYNKLQGFTNTEEILPKKSLLDMWASCGFEVIRVDGHNFDELRKAFGIKSDKPKVIIADTIKCKGVSFMENKIESHYKPLRGDQIGCAMRELS